MKKKLKKVVAVILTMAMAMSASVPAFAAIENEMQIEPQDYVMDSRLELVDSDTKWFYNILVPGQDPEGEIYLPGSSIVYTESGGDLVSVSFSFNVGAVSLTVDPGALSHPGEATARNIGVNTTNPCLLYVDKKIKCDQYALYERLLGTNGEWKFVKYIYKSSELSTKYHVDEV